MLEHLILILIIDAVDHPERKPIPPHSVALKLKKSYAMPCVSRRAVTCRNRKTQNFAHGMPKK
jgi:hypothetical protein